MSRNPSEPIMNQPPNRNKHHRRHGYLYSPLKDIAGELTPFIYVGPTLLLIVVLLIYPLVSVFYYSTLDWSGLGKGVFIGLANYVSLFADSNFWDALVTNLIYVAFFSIIPTVLGVIIATIVGRTMLRGERVFRAILLTPQVVASVAMGVIFSWIFAPGFGVVNGILGIVGLSSWQHTWLGSMGLARLSVGLVGTWMWVGFAVIVFVAGIKKIDVRIFDAVRIDGANEIQQFFAITLPEIRAEFVVVIIVTLIRAFGSNVFGIVSAITGGGYHTQPLSLLAYNLAFIQNRMGYGSAVIVFLIIVILGLSALTFRVGEQER